MTAGITEVFTDGCTGKWCEILHGSRIGSRSSHNHRIIHGSLFTECTYDAGNGRTLLSDCNVDTVHRITGFVIGTLVDDGIDGNSRLSSLAVTDDQLTLSASDRNHGIDRLQTGLKRFCYRLTENNSRSLAFQRHFKTFAADFAASVHRYTQRVDDTSQHSFSHIDGSNSPGTFYDHALLDLVSRTEQHSSDIILFQIHHGTHYTVFKLLQSLRWV